MRNEGWTLGDLAGELMARGIDMDDVSDEMIGRVLSAPRPELAARAISRGEAHDPTQHREGCECLRCYERGGATCDPAD
jgi:hypothetical protein